MKKLFIIFAFVCLATSCIKQEDIAFNGIENLTVSEFSLKGALINADLNMTNNSRKNIEVKELEVKITDNNSTLARASLKEAVVFDKKSTQNQNITIVAKLDKQVSPLALMTLQSRLNKLMVSGYISAKVGAINKTIDIEAMSLEQLMKNFGIDK